MALSSGWLSSLRDYPISATIVENLVMLSPVALRHRWFLKGPLTPTKLLAHGCEPRRWLARTLSTLHLLVIGHLPKLLCELLVWNPSTEIGNLPPVASSKSAQCGSQVTRIPTPPRVPLLDVTNLDPAPSPESLPPGPYTAYYFGGAKSVSQQQADYW